MQQGKAPVDIVNIRRIRSLRCGGKQFKLLSVELQPLDKNQCVSDAVCCYGAKNKTPTRLLFKKNLKNIKKYIFFIINWTLHYLIDSFPVDVLKLLFQKVRNMGFSEFIQK